MDPLEPNDPLWNLLGSKRPVEPRGNFVQNVVRTARQTPQDSGIWARIRSAMQETPWGSPRLALGVSCALLLAAGIFLLPEDEQRIVAPTVVATPAPAVEGMPLVTPEAPFESMDEVSALLALEDTSTLSDSQIHFLLY